MSTPANNGFANVKLPHRCMELINANRLLAEKPVEGAKLSNRAVIEVALEQHHAVLTGEKDLVDPGALESACRDADTLTAILEYLRGVGICIKLLGNGESFDPIIDRRRLAEAFGLYPGYPIRPKTAEGLMAD